MITTQDLVPKHILELPRVHEQPPHRLQRVQDREQEQEENENERHEHDQQERHSLHLRERDLYVRRLYRAITTVRFHVSDVSIFLRVRPCRLPTEHKAVRITRQPFSRATELRPASALLTADLDTYSRQRNGSSTSRGSSSSWSSPSAASATSRCRLLSFGSPIGKLYGNGTKATRGAATPFSMESATVGTPSPSIALLTSPTDRWHRGHEGVSSAASTWSSASLRATSGAVFASSGAGSWMAPMKEKSLSFSSPTSPSATSFLRVQRGKTESRSV